MTKQQMTRKRLCGAFYVLVTLLTVGALALAACGKGGAAYRLFFSEPDALLAFFPPLFVAEYLLWRSCVYLFCTSAQTARGAVCAVLYGLLGLGMLAFSFRPGVKWGLTAAYAALRGAEALADIYRARREGQRGLAEGFFILIVLSVAFALMAMTVALGGVLLLRDWVGSVVGVALAAWFLPLLLAEGLLRKGILDLLGGGARVFPVLYVGVAVGILLFSGGGPFAVHSSWMPVCVYGAVQAADTLFGDLRTPRGKEA